MSNYYQEFCAKCGNGYPPGQLCKLCLPQPSIIEPGTRVRVTYEGVVEEERTRSRKHYQRVSIPGQPHHFHAIYPTDTVEILAPPEREFEDGAYYLTPLDQHALRYDADTDCFADRGVALYRTCFKHEQLDRFVKLVPEDSE